MPFKACLGSKAVSDVCREGHLLGDPKETRGGNEADLPDGHLVQAVLAVLVVRV